MSKTADPGCVQMILGICVAIGMVGYSLKGCVSSPAQDTQASAAKAAEDRRKGFHCLSDWDGSNASVVRLVKAGLREPDSFEHVGTRIMPVNERGEHEAFMEYRARNGFGGMNVETVMAVIRQGDCSAKLSKV